MKREHLIQKVFCHVLSAFKAASGACAISEANAIQNTSSTVQPRPKNSEAVLKIWDIKSHLNLEINRKL